MGFRDLGGYEVTEASRDLGSQWENFQLFDIEFKKFDVLLGPAIEDDKDRHSP